MELPLAHKNPEQEVLKEDAREAHNRLLDSLRRLQHKLHVPEEVPDEDNPAPKIPNGKHG